MQFIDNNPIYKIIRTTGPYHNFLVVKLSEKELENPTIIEDLASHQVEAVIAKEDVLNQVVSGIEQASLELNHHYFVEKIQFLSTDTQSVSVYKYLAGEIINRIIKQR